ncbi:ATP-binding protein [Saccharothrix sp. NRRL B-16348]|uniref:ATP-binding protein n=1 Tax=Saccharothrix sp. NRRL B-16348 TaxID=1415542 RepID=UPI001E655372|nr:tetratricopeptide repeat protein [Saccharothrix sp. NRRL B-16348]
MKSTQAVHRTIVVVDVEGFGDPRRTLPHQVGTRAGLYRVVARAMDAAGVPWRACYHEDRGDGIFVLVPPRYAKGPLVEVLPEALVRALQQHNDTSPAAQHTRLRVAVHAGEVALDGHGATSTALTTAFRLLNAPPVRQALAESPGLVAFVVSHWIFDEVVQHSDVLDPATFRPVSVAVKEIHETAWITLPDHPYPVDSAVVDRLAGHPAPPGSDDSARSPAAPPRQLPAPPTPFVGRDEQLITLDHAVTGADTGADNGGGPATGTAVFISAIGGAGGIGKTWLALHWAHRHAHRFPDGQLFVDLHGFSPVDHPLEPAAVLRGFLGALGIAPGHLPADLDAQAALYRSLVAGRRMLIVLDNAATADQIVPLLPGTSTCTVLVTGRTKLASLIERHGAHHLPLNVLTRGEAHALLSERLGGQRVAAEPGVTDELVGLCGYHPLALAITARHAATRPHIPLAEFAAELRDLGLDMLDDDPTASLSTVLSWSLRHLTGQQRTVFALLSMAPGPDIDVSAAACLTGLSTTQTRKILHTLEDNSLLDRHPHGRYAMHDLVRAYAATTVRDNLSEPQRRAALDRVVDFYLHTAHAAACRLYLLDPPVRLDPPASGAHPLPPRDPPAALAWLHTHHPHLLAAQRTAAVHHRHHAVWHLAWTLGNFHYRQGHFHDDLAVWQAAADASVHLPDPTAQTLAYRFLGHAHAELGGHEPAIGHLHQALALATQHHDTSQQAHTHHFLARAWELQGDHRQAFEHARQALDLHRALDQPVWEANALNTMGWHAARLGDYETARVHCQQALALHRHHDNPHAEADTRDSLGWIHHHTGQHQQAVHYYRQALTLYRTLGNTTQAADTLDHLGHPHAALDQHDQARAAWQQALGLYQAQGRYADAERVRKQLDDLTDPDGTQ